MPMPRPEPGLVVRYGYVWREQSRGDLVNSKDRPACIVAAFVREGRRTRVVLLPITRSSPRDRDDAVELPPKVKAHLGLGQERSWVIVSECNVDVWPSPDLAGIPGKPGMFAYGFVRVSLFASLRERYVACAESQRLHQVHREDEDQ